LPDGQPAQEAEVRGLIAEFLRAFNDLDWPAFKKCGSNQPVVFYPAADPQPTGRRTDEWTDFEAAWDRHFRAVRQTTAKRGVMHPPFQSIEPKDLRIDFPAPTVAVVTFHLGPDSRILGRRMFVIVKRADGWKITHLHASNFRCLPRTDEAGRGYPIGAFPMSRFRPMAESSTTRHDLCDLIRC
jgi:ketosteroid isomerase-like protein